MMVLMVGVYKGETRSSQIFKSTMVIYAGSHPSTWLANIGGLS